MIITKPDPLTETQMLIGSLSNDLFRIANLTYRGSTKASIRFAQESKRWAIPLMEKDIPPYIKKIAKEIAESENKISKKTSERYLMYGVLLQNYAYKQRTS